VVNLAVRVQTLRIKGLTAWYTKYEVSLSQSKAQFFKSPLEEISAYVNHNTSGRTILKLKTGEFNPYPTAFPYGNGMVLHFYQQQESSRTKTVHKVINKGLKTYV